ncbi:MAG: ATP-binding cassette domain-containing protein [Candidatus Methylacidiphilales bacterium]|nr:ATP-binding cassette domain-containing protein [Candidatus Methylacidiphilales bacterium]
MIKLPYREPIVVGSLTGDNNQQTLKNTVGIKRADIADTTGAVFFEHIWLEPEGGLHRAFPLAPFTVNNIPCQREAGTLLNLGDRIALSRDITYIYQGKELELQSDVVDQSIPAVLAEKISRTTPPVFREATLRAGQGEFIGVLGLSGMGKSTLLKLLCGQWQTETGRVLINGKDVADIAPGTLGYVPQEDLLHHELTVRQALIYSAQLRRSRPDRREALLALVDNTIERVGLQEQANNRVGTLSGGQRKRASIALQLIDQPKILLLDEPSSGLDPSREAELMMLLARLTAGGCTIICTTHVLYNVHLFSQLWFVHKAPNEKGGGILFAGTPSESRRRFGVDRVDQIYSLLLHNQVPPPPAAAQRMPPVLAATRQTPAPRAKSWIDQFEDMPDAQAPAGHGFPPPPPPPPPPVAPAASAPVSRPRPVSAIRNFFTLLARLNKLLWAHPTTLLVLIGQALVIGFMIGVMTPNPVLASFLAVISAMWFGCSNAAQEIVKEVDIFRREAIAGLGCGTYLASKTFFWSIITSMQSLLLAAVVLTTIACVHPKSKDETFPNQKHFPVFMMLAGDVVKKEPDQGPPGAAELADMAAVRYAAAEQVAIQFAVLVAISVSSVTIGLAVSALSSTATQAQFMIPIILIPQLLGGGVVVGLAEMESWVRQAVSIMPSAAAQRMMEVAHVNLLTRKNDMRHYQTEMFRREPSEKNQPVTPLTDDNEKPQLSNQSRVPQFLEEDPYRKPGLREDQNPFTTTMRPHLKDYYAFTAPVNVLRNHPTGLAWQNLGVDFDHMGERTIRYETTWKAGTTPLAATLVETSLDFICTEPRQLEENCKRLWLVNDISKRQLALERASYSGREDVFTRKERQDNMFWYAISSTVIIAGWMMFCLLASYLGLRKSISAG